MQPKRQRLHFIAIGGSVMHSLAIELKKAGHSVTGSDDEFFEPSNSELARHGLLPSQSGWYPDRIDASLDGVVLGMHAKADNPELVKAQSLGIPVYSFPDFIYASSTDKQRIVIAGSHGKSTITGIVAHVLNYCHRSFDYVIGARLKGLESNVRLSQRAPIIIIEGDEYYSSALDHTPKFVRYQHHIGLISGIAWDHANVYPTEDEYVRQFDKFCDETPKGGILIFSEQDSLSMIIGKKERTDVLQITFRAHPHILDNGTVFLTNGKERYPVRVFGAHNLSNISAAKELLKRIGISNEQFYEAIQTFEGVAGRLEKVFERDGCAVYKDFAHAPSKVRATVKAVKENYGSRELVACLELHTYSSLDKRFLPQYKDAMKGAQIGIVYFNPSKVESKGLEALSREIIRSAFNAPNLLVFTQADELQDYIQALPFSNRNLLMMSSGNFGGIDLAGLSKNLKP
jgi:UDP-N-acetylmuramate: L-alanyl-gamma-D-glutamyl-meso-diaminopimelate ligase